MLVAEVADDGAALPDGEIAVDESGHLPVGVEKEVLRCLVLLSEDVHEDELHWDACGEREVVGDARVVGEREPIELGAEAGVADIAVRLLSEDGCVGVSDGAPAALPFILRWRIIIG